MTATKVSDHILERLRAWGVAHVFGCPGEGIDGLLAAWARAGDEPRFVRAPHEKSASLEAVGYAKFSGHVGVCAVASGPGATHLLNGLYDARLDHVPVVAIIGQPGGGTVGGAHQQEAELRRLFEDVAAAGSETVRVPGQLPDVLDRAIRTAYADRAPTAVIVPADVQDLAYPPTGQAHKLVPSSLDASGGAPVPDDRSVVRAAEILNAGDRVALLIGQGAAQAAAEVAETAELLGAGVAKSLLGKDALSDLLPYVTGCIGPLGTRPSYELMRDCDTLLTIGSGFPYSEFLPPYGQARAVRIDIDPHPVGPRYPYEVDLVGDAAATLRALRDLLRPVGDRSWQDGVVRGVRRWRTAMARQAGLGGNPVNPAYVAHTLDPLLPADAMITVDSGPVATWYARHLTMRDGMRGTLSGTLATTGCAVPYAMGAKFAHPDRPAVALVDDGEMRANGLTELAAIAEHAGEWTDPRLIVAVWNNRDPYADFARSLGMAGIHVTDPGRVEDAWRAALSADGPTVLDFRTDPAVSPIPPHASWDRFETTAGSARAGATT
ncbi:thiamine pyrophosphate-requiring protein [Streptomyces sp. ISL-43]|uniref:thiamine pyrophosphate-binding protein n=1 Tax=Streptomyces sp. ISL-43 TaxID=2819183 RepID=UPI001BEA1E63|nr:thiamine pyrophosphate-binding protein [Streptomyces sp. ISL-43]MBT2448645.1 thiamine pyrophosphate-requiring protein [Streptomyces sp. ISL-43]